MSKKKSKNSDRPLDAEESKEVKACIRRGYTHLGLKPGASPVRVQETLRDVIDLVILGKKKLAKKNVEEFAFDLGCLWGETVCDAFDWEWCVASANSDEFLAVTSPNRSHAVAVLGFVSAQLEKRRPEENTSFLVFNMLKEGSFEKAKADSYVTIG